MRHRGSPLVVQEAGSLEELREDWARLSQLDGDLFKTWEWARAWEDTYGSEGRVLLTFRRDDEPITGIARLTRTRRAPLRLFGFEGQGPADQVGPVCAPADRAVVATALRSVLSTRGGGPGVLLACGLMREQSWGPLLGGALVKTRPSPVLEFNGLDWPGWLASKSSNFRQQAQRRERKLIRDHGLDYHRISSADELSSALEQLVAFHDARWQGESDFFAAGGRALHGAFARRALERGWLRLWVADLHGQPAAFWLGYSFANEYWFFQLARDPQWHPTSIGMVLLAHTVRCAFEEDAVRYRFLSGGHEYKLRFANSDAHHDTVLVTEPGLAGLASMAVSAARQARSVTKPLRSARSR
jgi:CelD/BcsL family acetyltransferase involved in cellulose biosynthesis